MNKLHHPHNRGDRLRIKKKKELLDTYPSGRVRRRLKERIKEQETEDELRKAEEAEEEV
jgi:hypothetical protein